MVYYYMCCVVYRRLLVHDPAQRASPAEALSHPYITQALITQVQQLHPGRLSSEGAVHTQGDHTYTAGNNNSSSSDGGGGQGKSSLTAHASTLELFAQDTSHDNEADTSVPISDVDQEDTTSADAANVSYNTQRNRHIECPPSCDNDSEDLILPVNETPSPRRERAVGMRSRVRYTLYTLYRIYMIL